MANLVKYYSRSRHPKGFWGKRVLKEMNSDAHAALPEWALDKFQINKHSSILDIGCGGGANIRRMLALEPTAAATGIDISPLSLAKTLDENYPSYVDKRFVVIGGNAMQMPFARDIFDVATAFETIYYWPSLDNGITEAMRVVKPGGLIVIANEMDGMSPDDENLAHAVGGMRIYTPEEIKESMTEAGLEAVKVHQDEERHFVCVIGKKSDKASQR